MRRARAASIDGDRPDRLAQAVLAFVWIAAPVAFFVAAHAQGAAGRPAVPEPAPAAPAPDALALAQAFVPPVDPSRLDALADDLAQQIGGVHLAYRGPGCDRTLPACRAAALAVARQAAPALATERRDRRVRVLARVFDAKMSADERRSSLAFLRSAAGLGFARALDAATDVRSLPPALLAQLGAEMMRPDPAATRLSTLAERVFDRTRDLPRGASPLVPPPPVPSPSVLR